MFKYFKFYRFKQSWRSAFICSQNQVWNANGVCGTSVVVPRWAVGHASLRCFQLRQPRKICPHTKHTMYLDTARHGLLFALRIRSRTQMARAVPRLQCHAEPYDWRVLDDLARSIQNMMCVYFTYNMFGQSTHSAFICARNQGQKTNGACSTSVVVPGRDLCHAGLRRFWLKQPRNDVHVIYLLYIQIKHAQRFQIHLHLELGIERKQRLWYVSCSTRLGPMPGRSQTFLAQSTYKIMFMYSTYYIFGQSTPRAFICA